MLPYPLRSVHSDYILRHFPSIRLFYDYFTTICTLDPGALNNIYDIDSGRGERAAETEKTAEVHKPVSSPEALMDAGWRPAYTW